MRDRQRILRALWSVPLFMDLTQCYRLVGLAVLPTLGFCHARTSQDFSPNLNNKYLGGLLIYCNGCSLVLA